MPAERISAISQRQTFHISQSFTNTMAAKAIWHRNYVTVTLCIGLLPASPRKLGAVHIFYNALSSLSSYLSTIPELNTEYRN